jgi:hypothetical protein
LSKLDDIFGDKTPKEDKEWILTDMNVQCGDCPYEADEVYLSRDRKNLRTVHRVGAETHITESKIDLSWLTN